MSILERCPLFKGFPRNDIKLISKADYESRNIPLTTNFISLYILMLFGLPIKAVKIKSKKKAKFLSDVNMSIVELVP